MRLFTAFELPNPVKLAVGEVIDELKASGANVKWVRPQGMHLTLKFLGEVEEAEIPRVMEALEQACQGFGPLDLEVAGCGSFPGRGKPQVVWLGIAGQLEALASLAAAVDGSMADLGFEPERRPFKAHLTLGRLRRPKRGKKPPDARELIRAVAGLADFQGPRFQAARAALIKSTLTPTGAVYDPIHIIGLGE